MQELNSGMVKLSVLCLQEIWCVPPYEDFALDGYHPIFYSQRDPSGRNRNAGGGVALWCDSVFSQQQLKVSESDDEVAS